MDETARTARALAALGHDVRLRLFRLLVQAGEEGLTVGAIGAHLGLPASTLSHHLSALVDADLVVQERQGRKVMNRARYATMNAALAFLTRNCCEGVALVETQNAA